MGSTGSMACYMPFVIGQRTVPDPVNMTTRYEESWCLQPGRQAIALAQWLRHVIERELSSRKREVDC